MKNTKYIFLGAILATGFLVTSVWVRAPRVVQAADNNFTDGITVDSTGDGTDANTADSICDDGSGNCTLRAAIEESNQEAGAQTIKFNITGPEDFNNGGQSGYSIKPTSGLPNITDTVTINGYTQPGSLANTAIAPNPLNGRLLVEVDGVNQNITGINFSTGGDNSIIKGLIINRFQSNGIRILGSDAVKVQGNYVGTDYTGMTARPNGSDNSNSSTAISVGENGLNATDLSTTNTFLGGLNPEDRNLISGNYGGGVGIGSVDTTIQGNYVGVARDGATDLGNSYGSGVTTGGFTVDYADGVLFGGPQIGAKNVISGNATGGIQPDYSTDVVIESNYLGTDYTGTIPVPNDLNAIGFAIGTGISGIVKNNLIRFNGQNGISISANGNVTITGNIINSNQGNSNISISGIPGLVQNTVIQGNKIGTDVDGKVDDNFTQNIGILMTGNVSNNLIGGEGNGEGNIIAGNDGAGVVVAGLNIIGLGTLTPYNNTIIGNSIFDNNSGTPFGFTTPGIGIDQSEVTLNGFVPQSIAQSGPTLNDPSDSDTGPNDYLNFPVINSTTASAGKLDVTFNLDVPSSPAGYRVEFFASSTADPSGYGEGQIYLGSTNVAGSVTNAIASLNIPSSFNSGNYAITATTTAKDDSTDGFGSTSEFSAVLGAQTVLAAVNTTNNTTTTAGGSLANTGQNSTLIALLAGGGIVSGASWLVVIRQRAKTRR